MKRNYKKIALISLMLLLCCVSVFADANGITVNTGITDLDTPISNFFAIVRKLALVGIILGIILCGATWAIQHIIMRDNSQQNEKLMQMLIRIGIAILVVAVCVFFPISIYNAIDGNGNKNSTVKSDFCYEKVMDKNDIPAES